MPLFVIERSFAEQLELTGADVRLIESVNADAGVQWLFSFLDRGPAEKPTASTRRRPRTPSAPPPRARASRPTP